MGSTNRGRLTSAVTDGRATRVVIRLDVAIELVMGLTLLIIPGVVIRALIGADEGTASTIVGRGARRCPYRSWDRWRISKGSYARAAHRPCLCRIQRIDGHCSRGRQCRWHSKRDPALAGGCSARASGFGSPRRPVTKSAVTYGQPVTRHWNLRSVRRHLLRQPEVGAIAADLPDGSPLALARQQSVQRRQAASYCRHRPHPVGIRHCPIPSSLVVVWLAGM